MAEVSEVDQKAEAFCVYLSPRSGGNGAINSKKLRWLGCAKPAVFQKSIAFLWENRLLLAARFG